MNDHTIEVQKNSHEIKSLALKQLSRGRFVVEGGKCSVVILHENELKTVVFTNDVSIYELSQQLYTAYLPEPSLDFMRNKINSYEVKLIDFVKEYQEKYYLLGSEFNGAKWFKLYNASPVDDPRRDQYHASWIDYEKQLECGNIIYDKNKLCGLWAVPYDFLLNCLNDECKTRYGSKLLILEPIPDCRYLDDGKEIIGDRYSVVGKYDLDNIYEVGEFIKEYISLEGISHAEQIVELKNEIYKQKRDNEALYDQLDSCLYKVKRGKTLKWLFLVLGIILGFIFKLCL